MGRKGARFDWHAGSSRHHHVQASGYIFYLTPGGVSPVACMTRAEYNGSHTGIWCHRHIIIQKYTQAEAALHAAVACCYMLPWKTEDMTHTVFCCTFCFFLDRDFPLSIPAPL